MNPMLKAPLLVRIFSYFFIFMGVVALAALSLPWLDPDQSAKVSITFLTNSFTYGKSPALFAATSFFFVFAGITGISIVRQKAYAYDLGIAYSIAGLVFFDALVLLKTGLINQQILSLVIQTLFFGGFLAYLIKHRPEWKKANASQLEPRAS